MEKEIREKRLLFREHDRFQETLSSKNPNVEVIRSTRCYSYTRDGALYTEGWEGNIISSSYHKHCNEVPAGLSLSSSGSLLGAITKQVGKLFRVNACATVA